jgi:hypothetical protein
MTTYRKIPLTNPGLIADEYWLIHLAPNEDEWDVREIEIYWDREHTQLKSEDNQIKDLPKPVQAAIYLELEHWHQARRQRVFGVQKLLQDIGNIGVKPILRLVETS